MSGMLGERDGKIGLSHWNVGDQSVRRRHEPTGECSGRPRPTVNLGPGTRPFGAVTCPECEQELCPCEEA